MDIATASPLVILEVVTSLFSGIIGFLEYKLVIFLKLPDVKFGVTSGIVMLSVELVRLVVKFNKLESLFQVILSVVFIVELFRVLTTI